MKRFRQERGSERQRVEGPSGLPGPDLVPRSESGAVAPSTRWRSPPLWSAVFLAVVFAIQTSGGDEPDTPVRIEPTVDVVPANHLKFYLHFPGPMERGNVFRYLRLVQIDEDGNEVAEVPEPFREVELWDETFTRMTLWFHPGRQKPGVNLNVEIGPILEEGKRYRLEASDEWKTETGSRLAAPLTHEFAAGPPDNGQPDPSGWELKRIKGSLGRSSVKISTGELLDPVSVRKRVRVFVEDKEVEFEYSGQTLSFDVGLGDSSRVKALVDPQVEDLAGNSVARPFNLDLEKYPELEEADIVELTFQLPKFIP